MVAWACAPYPCPRMSSTRSPTPGLPCGASPSRRGRGACPAERPARAPLRSLQWPSSWSLPPPPLPSRPASGGSNLLGSSCECVSNEECPPVCSRRFLSPWVQAPRPAALHPRPAHPVLPRSVLQFMGTAGTASGPHVLGLPAASVDRLPGTFCFMAEPCSLLGLTAGRAALAGQPGVLPACLPDRQRTHA